MSQKINKKVNSAWSKSTALYAKAASALNVGYPEMMVLYALDAEGKLTQIQIAENYGMQKQTVNTVVRSLKQRGYAQLTAGKTDRRAKILSLTDSGKAYAKELLRPLKNTEDKIYRMIGEERLQAMVDILDLYNLLFERELKADFREEEDEDE